MFGLGRFRRARTAFESRTELWRQVGLGSEVHRREAGRQLYETAVHGTRGQVYATIDESVAPDFGRCGHARSNLVRLRRP